CLSHFVPSFLLIFVPTCLSPPRSTLFPYTTLFRSRDQHLHAAAWRVPAHRADRRGPVRGAAVREVVTIDGRDHDVLEPELAHRPADPLGLLAVLPDGRAVRDRAVAAVSRADVAQDHERRGRVLPAFADVGTVRLLADRVEVPLAQPALASYAVGASGGAELEPRRLWHLRPPS